MPKKRVLIIDDDARNIFALTATGQRSGYFYGHLFRDAGRGADRLRCDFQT